MLNGERIFNIVFYCNRKGIFDGLIYRSFRSRGIYVYILNYIGNYFDYLVV